MYGGRMQPLRWDHRPDGLRAPAMVCAFKGWNDAGDAASSALGFVGEALGATRFAVDRPRGVLRLPGDAPHDPPGRRSPPRDQLARGRGLRRARARAPARPRPVAGAEPVLPLAHLLRHGPRSLRGARRADRSSPSAPCSPTCRTPARSPSPGWPPTRRWSTASGSGRSSYQGPTGITGVLHGACQARGIPQRVAVGRRPALRRGRRPTRRARSRSCASSRAWSASLSTRPSSRPRRSSTSARSTARSSPIQRCRRSSSASSGAARRGRGAGRPGVRCPRRPARPRVPALPAPARAPARAPAARVALEAAPRLRFARAVVDTSAYAAITPLLPSLSDEYGLDKGEAGTLSAAYPRARCCSPPGRLADLAHRAQADADRRAGHARARQPRVRPGGQHGHADRRALPAGRGAAAMWAGALAWLVGWPPRAPRRGDRGGDRGGHRGRAGRARARRGRRRDEHRAVFGAYVAVPLAMIAWAVRIPGAPLGRRAGAGRGGAAVRDAVMRRGMWMMALPALGFGLINVLVPLRLDDLGAGAAVIAAAFLGAVALEALMSPIVGRMADRRAAILPGAHRPGGRRARAGAAAASPQRGPGRAGRGVRRAAAGDAVGPGDGAALRGGRGARPGRGARLRPGQPGLGAGATVGAGGGGALAKATDDVVPYLVVATLAIGTAWWLGRQKARRRRVVAPMKLRLLLACALSPSSPSRPSRPTTSSPCRPARRRSSGKVPRTSAGAPLYDEAARRAIPCDAGPARPCEDVLFKVEEAGKFASKVDGGTGGRPRRRRPLPLQVRRVRPWRASRSPPRPPPATTPSRRRPRRASTLGRRLLPRQHRLHRLGHVHAPSSRLRSR